MTQNRPFLSEPISVWYSATALRRVTNRVTVCTEILQDQPGGPDVMVLSINSALRKLRQEKLQFETSTNYIVSLCPQKSKCKEGAN